MGTRYQRVRRYPTSQEAFDKLPHGEQWDIKVNLLTDNSVFLHDSLNPDCVHDLVASGTLSPSEGERVSTRVRYECRQEGIQELLKILPRCGDSWWRSLDDSLRKRGQYELYHRLNPWLQEEQHGASGEPPSPSSPSLPQGPADDGKSLGGVDVQAVLNNPDMLRALVTELTRQTDPRGAPIVPPGPFSVNGSQQNASSEEAGAQITQWNVSEKEDMGTLALNDKKYAMMSKKDDKMAMFTDESASNRQPRSAPAKPEESTQDLGSSADRSPPHRLLCLDTEIVQLGQRGEETTSSLAKRQYTDKSSAGTPDEELESMTSIVENDMQPSIAKNAATRRPSEDKKLNTATPSAPSLLGTLQQDQAQAVTKYTRQPETQSGDPDDKDRGKSPFELSESGMAGEDGQERESLLEDGVTEQVSLLTNDNGRELLSSFHSDPQGQGGDLTATLLPSVPLPSAAPSAPASPSPSSGEGSNTSTHIVNHHTTIIVNAPVQQLNVAKENRLTKQVSLSVPSTPTCNAQGGTQEGADPEEQDPYCDRDFPASTAQPRSCFSQETAEETAIQSQDHSQSDQGLNGTGNVERAGPESSYYRPWDCDAQQTALKVVCTEETIDTENQQELDYEPSPGDAGRTDMSFVDLSYARNTATQLNTLSDSCEAASFSACVTRTQDDNDAASQQTDYTEISGRIPQGRQRRQEMGHSGEAESDDSPSVSEDCGNQTVQGSDQHSSSTQGWPFFALWTVIKEGLQHGLSLLE